ncbi:MAG: glutathione S-transferase family protein [Gammaproteobacteria bacterium]|jgi:glutathione S-transferase|nr:glutathione S-transferase family protein [Gammaproteobacteria bacterium]
MRLFDFNRAPNPRRARIFIAEKGLDIPRVNVNLYRMEQLSPQFLAINPDGTLPVLETDDGHYLTETVAIAHYLEQLHPEPRLMGQTPLQSAEVLRWNSIVEQQGMMAIAETLRNWSPGFANHVFPGPVEYAQMPELIERGARRTHQFFDRIEQQLQASRYLAGDEYTFADISLLAMTDFAGWVEIKPQATRPALARWHAEVSTRPSARA